LIAVDHGTRSIDESRYRNSFTVFLRVSSNLWWTGAINRGLEYVFKWGHEDDFVLIINDDVTFHPDYLENLMACGKENRDTLVGSVCEERGLRNRIRAELKLSAVMAKFKARHSDRELAKMENRMLDSDILSGRGMLIPFLVFRDIGSFDEDGLPHYGADSEFSWRARKHGYKVVCATKCRVFTQDKDDRVYQYGSSFREFITNKKKPGNFSTVVNFSFVCFGRFYAAYYISINFGRHLLSYIKRFVIRR
jgi:GT2 family glycosyltransferase